MNTGKNLNVLQKLLCSRFTQFLIKFSQINFLRVGFNNCLGKLYIVLNGCLGTLRIQITFLLLFHLIVIIKFCEQIGK